MSRKEKLTQPFCKFPKTTRMSNDKGFFDTPEFRNLLKKYEQSRRDNSSCYFESDQLSDILSYYLYYEKTAEVEEVYATAKRLHPESPEVTKMEIRMLLSYGNTEAALGLFERLQYIDDDDTLLLKAEVHLALKDYKSSRKIARELLRRSTITDETAYEALEILLDCGFAQEVLAAADEGLKRYPDSINLLEVKAESLIELQHTDEAIKIYNKLLDETPYSTFYWEQLGHIYYMIGRFGKALECFEYELTIDENIEYAKMMQGYCYHHLHDYSKSRELFTRLGQKYPKSIIPDFYVALADAYSGNSAEAIEAFCRIATKGMEKSNNESIEAMLALLNVAILYQQAGNYDASSTYTKRAILQAPSNESIKQIIAHRSPLYELRDKENMTFTDINATETKEWKIHEILYRLGTQFLEQEANIPALTAFYIARPMTPDTTDIDAFIAYILYSLGETKEDFRRMVASALQGKSEKLFYLFGQPYNADIMPDDFIARIHKE